MIKSIKYIFLSLLFIFFTEHLYSQQNSSLQKNIGETFLEDGLIFLKDGGSFFTYPLRMSGREWLYTGLGSAGIYGLMHFDEKIKDAIGRDTEKTLNGDFWDIPTYYGYIQYANLAALSTYGIGLFTKQDDVRIVGRMLFQSLSYSGITVMFFRTIFGRQRPYSGEGAWVFDWFKTGNEEQSFPSGHCTVAFSFSTVLAEYFDSWWSRVVFYGMASLTAYARVLNNQHWFSDVVVGSLIGLAGGFFTINAEKNRHVNSKFSFLPTINGINFSYRID